MTITCIIIIAIILSDVYAILWILSTPILCQFISGAHELSVYKTNFFVFN